MTVTHTWNIEDLKQLNDGTGTVCEVEYSIDSSDGEVNRRHHDIVNLNTENIENFISYQDLTEEIVLNWVKESLGEERKNHIESHCERIIDLIKNPPAPAIISTPLPWEN